MYLRTIQRRNKDGSVARYVQLAHNVRLPGRRNPVAQVIHSFGREDQLDRQALARLVRSISRFLEPGEQLAAAASEELRFLESRPFGGGYVLGAVWRRLGIEAALVRLAGGRRVSSAVERLIFALVCNRALAPSSKRAALEWAREDTQLPAVGALGSDPQVFYRAMDFLLDCEEEIQREVFFAVANLLNLEVDVIFFDSSSTYFEIEEEDEADAEQGLEGLRRFGNSKDRRPDLPQVVVGLAVTREGIPVRCWVFPGNASDQVLIRQVKDDLRAWKLNRVLWVVDTGFASAENRRYLQRAGGHYIIGEKLRGDSTEAAAALRRPGRYRAVAGNLHVKEVVIDDATMRDRFVICHNPEQAERDQAVRTALVAQLEKSIVDSDGLPAEEREEVACRLHAKPAIRKWLRVTAGGKLRIDRAAIRAEQHLDGKFLLRTSDPTLSAEDVALGYKQLLQVERAWRDMKSTLDLRPVFHRKEERIRAHVLLCWLSLLLIRIAEHSTQDTWRNLSNQLDRLHLGTFTGPSGVCRKRTDLLPRHREILRALQIPEPPLFVQLTLPAAAKTA